MSRVTYSVSHIEKRHNLLTGDEVIHGQTSRFHTQPHMLCRTQFVRTDIFICHCVLIPDEANFPFDNRELSRPVPLHPIAQCEEKLA